MAHKEDLDAHIRSVHEDMEYWRTKRVEPRIVRLLRKGKIGFNDMLQASSKSMILSDGAEKGTALEDRVEALEFKLGDYIKAANIAASLTGGMMLVEEGREESGTYDESLRFIHKELKGSDEERTTELAKLLDENLRVLRTFLAVLVDKGMISEERLEEMLAAPVAPNYQNGAKVVARSWVDPEFRSRLLSDAKRTLREIGFGLNRTPKLVVVEDTDRIHNVIVCTLCSCYPYELLGNPPWWYKHDSYKQAIVANPRKTLREMFNLGVPEEIEVRVYDSTSDIRYMVLPKRPRGTEKMGEEELASLVTENSLIGVGDTQLPKARLTEA